MAQRVRGNVKEQLIVNGIEEMSKYGVREFSVRRVAQKCGVSCAAPYKHFKDRNSFVAAILEYINTSWSGIATGIASDYPNEYRTQLVQISLRYVRFLVENPHFRSILMLKDDEFDAEHRTLRTKVSAVTSEIVQKYCQSVQMPREVMERKLYVVRSLIYGAAILIDNKEMPYDDNTMEYVRAAIDREFDLA